jgi:glycosyltransferase involved in cell wall biosynthesis
MASGDLQVVALRPGMGSMVVPSKLYTALAYGAAVLVVAPEDSEAAKLVRDWQCGVVADPSDPRDVVNQIAWARNHPAELRAMRWRAREAAKAYDRTHAMGRLIDLIESSAG